MSKKQRKIIRPFCEAGQNGAVSPSGEDSEYSSQVKDEQIVRIIAN